MDQQPIHPDAPAAPGSSPPQTTPQNDQPLFPSPPAAHEPVPRRPRGKIAKLPYAVRTKLNELLDEGFIYREIIPLLGPEAAHITESDISRWYKSGYQDWIRNQVWLENTRTRLDMALDVLAQHEGSTVHHANLHIIATQLLENLITAGDKLLKDHCKDYTELVNSIARISHEALNFQKYKEAILQARAELKKISDPDHKPTEQETLAVVNRLDQILGFK